MKRMFMLALALAAVPLVAQPVRDLYDGLAAVRQQQRDLEPAIALAKETQLALKTLTTIQLSLVGATGSMPLDKAVQIIDAYLKDLTDRRSYLPRDVMIVINDSRKLFDNARINAPSDLQPLRDRFHHRFVAVLERRVLQDADQLTQIGQGYERMVAQMRGLQSIAISLASEASREPGKRDE
jgi:hypothetical protein